MPTAELVPVSSRLRTTTIWMPHPRPCQAARCGVPAAGHVVWIQSMHLREAEACAGHLTAFRDDEALACLVFQLDQLPDYNTLLAAVRNEHLRRKAASAHVANSTARYFTDFLNGGVTVNGTNMTFRFTAR